MYVGLNFLQRSSAVAGWGSATHVDPTYVSPGDAWFDGSATSAVLYDGLVLLELVRIFMQGHVLIADWSVAHFVVIMNDVMNDNMAAFAHVGARLGAFFYWTRFLENNVGLPFDNIPL